MKETKKVYALNSEKNSAYDEISSIKGRGDKKWWRSLRYKSAIHYKRKLKIKNVVIGAEYKCGDNMFKRSGALVRDFFGMWIMTLSRKARYRRQDMNLYNKMKGNKK